VGHVMADGVDEDEAGCGGWTDGLCGRQSRGLWKAAEVAPLSFLFLYVKGTHTPHSAPRISFVFPLFVGARRAGLEAGELPGRHGWQGPYATLLSVP